MSGGSVGDMEKYFDDDDDEPVMSMEEEMLSKALEWAEDITSCYYAGYPFDPRDLASALALLQATK